MTRYGAKVALLGGIIDYAGTFPPAALPLEGALRKAASFRREGRHPWLMGKIALPLSDIKALTAETLYKSGADGSPWLYAALGTAVESAEDLQRSLEWEMREARRLNDRRFDSAYRQWIVAYEVKLGAAASGEPFIAVWDRIAERAGAIIPFFELGWSESWRERLTSFAERLTEWAEDAGREVVLPGLKFRTGGKETPTPEQLASAVATCTRFGLKFKATQGLHHPVTDDKGFGFVNLFAALAFAQVLGEQEFPETQIARLLGEKTKSAFKFSRDALEWREFKISTDKIEEARRIHAATFGSCSIDEPDQFLAEDFPEEA